jgi:hypothetical protein
MREIAQLRSEFFEKRSSRPSTVERILDRIFAGRVLPPTNQHQKELHLTVQLFFVNGLVPGRTIESQDEQSK